MDQLVGYTAGLFVWVKTIIKILERGEVQQTLKQILGGLAGGMASLYTWILNTSFPSPDEDDIRDFHSVLGAIVFTRVPLDVLSLGSLLSMEMSAIAYIHNGLKSVLDFGDTLRIYHQSFTDFLLNPNECPSKFLLNRESANRNLAISCLRIMKKHL